MLLGSQLGDVMARVDVEAAIDATHSADAEERRLRPDARLRRNARRILARYRRTGQVSLNTH